MDHSLSLGHAVQGQDSDEGGNLVEQLSLGEQLHYHGKLYSTPTSGVKLSRSPASLSLISALKVNRRFATGLKNMLVTISDAHWMRFALRIP